MKRFEEKRAGNHIPAYEQPQVMKLGEAAKGRGDCKSGSGDAIFCQTGTNTDNCGGGSFGGAESSVRADEAKLDSCRAGDRPLQ